MYRKFQLREIDSNIFAYNTKRYQEIGESILKEQAKEIKTKLQSIVVGDGHILNGDEIQQNWFPKVECDVFISHSHKDTGLAVAIAGWLYKEFDLLAFVDSEIWGNSQDLLKEIDELFCRNDDGNTYDYLRRNQSTSHVYLMLNMALAQMIDNTECLFFLNTPSSVCLDDIKDSKTLSPWIFSEINLSNILRLRIPERLSITSSYSTGGALNERANDSMMNHSLDLNNFISLCSTDIIEWQRRCDLGCRKKEALDVLYKMKYRKVL